MIKLKDLITEVSGATRMSEKEWTMIHSKLKPNKKIIIQYKDRKGKNVRGFFVVKTISWTLKMKHVVEYCVQ